MDKPIQFSSEQPSTVLRPLGSLEEAFWLVDQSSCLHFTLTGKVKGETTVAGWRAALDAVQLRHPLLSVCIVKPEGSAPRFHHLSDALVPLRVVEGDTSVSRWESEVGWEMSQPFLPRQTPLLRAVLLYESHRAVCILVAHHSIADGLSLAFVFRDLLQALTGQKLAPLPVPPSHEELLGMNAGVARLVAVPEASCAKPAVRPGTYRPWDDAAPQIHSLCLTTALTGELRDRARQEGTTVHGALSSALALAATHLSGHPLQRAVRILSPIDTRRLLGLGEECALVVDGVVVPVEPRGDTGIWDVARRAINDLAPARTHKGLVANRRPLQQATMEGLDVQAAAGLLAQVFPHDILLSNIGNLRFATRFGALELEALWGPSIHMGFEGAQTVGVATVNGAMHLLHTSYAPMDSLLEVTEQVLVSACAPARAI